MLKERFSALYRATATALILTCAVSSASLPVFAANTGSSSSSSSSVSSASSGSGYIPSEVIKAQKEAEERKKRHVSGAPCLLEDIKTQAKASKSAANGRYEFTCPKQEEFSVIVFSISHSKSPSGFDDFTIRHL